MTDLTPQRVIVVIPALNEAGNIARLVSETRALRIPGAEIRVIVVDNGSSDATAQEATAAGARLVTVPRRGYGRACAAGAAAAEQDQADVLVFLDGDYSSLPSEMARVIAPILHDKADLSQGSRLLGEIAPGAMPLQQRLGNRLAAGLIRRLYRTTITDLGPYRAIRPQTLQTLALREMTYGWPVEMTVKAVRMGLRIAEPPVTFARRYSGRSKVSGTLRGTLLAAWFILGVTLRYSVQPPAGKVAAGETQQTGYRSHTG